jgi:vancomycin resistance protein YoaR
LVKKKASVQKEKVMYAYIAFFIIATMYVGTLFYSSVIYEDKIYPGISVAGIQVGEMTKSEAKETISKKAGEYHHNPVLSGKQNYELDEANLEVDYDIQGTVEKAFEVGRNDDLNPIKRYSENIPVIINLNTDKLADELISIASKENEKVEDAGLFMQGGELQTTKESIGTRVLLNENIELLKENLGNFQYDIVLQKKNINPNVKESDIKTAEKQIQEVLSRQIILKNGNKSYNLLEKSIAGFLSFQNNETSPSLVYSLSLKHFFSSPMLGTGVDISFDREAIRDWAVSFSGNIDVEPRNAKLSGSASGVQVISSSRDGRKVIIDDFVSKLSDVLEGSGSEVEIPVQVTKAEVRDDNLNELGLKGLISRGYSNFSGSPANRIHNIKVGASKFNGTLIKPGENFSFNETLGPVEAYTGYLPELVILKNKTVPEYGGGLCQVSSTAFRVALNAGLPITSRFAHAYPVQYYKPYGVDATIYLPSPDLRFRNDTGSYILIQTHISGNKLYFDFYGTKKDITLKFAGDAAGTQGVSDHAEGLTPTITEQEARGKGSFTATFYRLIYDSAGKLIKTNYWTSKYDSPDKYPH